MTTEGKEVGGFSRHRLTLSAFVLGVFFAQGALAAGDGTAAVGGGLGGALGNVVGGQMGGSTGAAIGAGVGGAAGSVSAPPKVAALKRPLAVAWARRAAQ